MRKLLLACLLGAALVGWRPDQAAATAPPCFDYGTPDLMHSSVDLGNAGAGALQVGNLIYVVGTSGSVEMIDISDRDQPQWVANGWLMNSRGVSSCQMRQLDNKLIVFWTGQNSSYFTGTWMTVLERNSLEQLREIAIPGVARPLTGCDMRLRFVYLARGASGLAAFDLTSDDIGAWGQVDLSKRYDFGTVSDVAFVGTYAYTVSGNTAQITRVNATNPANPVLDSIHASTVPYARLIFRVDDKIAVFGENRVGLYLFGGTSQTPELSALDIDVNASACTQVGNALFALDSVGANLYKIDISVPQAMEPKGYATLDPAGIIRSPRIFTAGTDVIRTRPGSLDLCDIGRFVGIEHLYSVTPLIDSYRFNGLEVDDTYAYVFLSGGGYSPDWLRIYDCSNPTTPALLGNLELPAHQLWSNEEFPVLDDHLFLTGWNGEVLVYDVSDVTAPTEVMSLPMPRTWPAGNRGWAVHGRFVYFASRIHPSSPPYANSKIFVLDAANPAVPFELFANEYFYPDDDNQVVDVAVDTVRNVLYALTARGLDAYEIAADGALTLRGHLEGPAFNSMDKVVLGYGDLYLSSSPLEGLGSVYFVETAHLSAMTLTVINPDNRDYVHDLAFDSELYLTGADEVDIYVPYFGWRNAYFQNLPGYGGYTGDPMCIAANSHLVAYLEGSHLVLTPKLCVAPQTIVAGSAHGESAGEVLDAFHWRFSWRTVGYSDPAQDYVSVTDPAGAPSACRIGSLVLGAATPGVEATVAFVDGYYLHTFLWRGATCREGCTYDFVVSSNAYESDMTSFTVGTCPPDIEIEGKSLRGPTVASFSPAAPNPFNPTTTLSFYVPAGARAMALDIHDAQGRLVRHLVDGDLTSGVRSLIWDGTTDRGLRAASGVYFARLVVDGASMVQKLVMLK